MAYGTSIYDSQNLRTNIVSRVREMFTYRQVMKLLVLRDITLRYKRSVIGVGWSLLNPLFTTAVLYFVFNSVFAGYLERSSDYLPYLLSGILTMTFFNQGLVLAAEAIPNARNMITKIYVPGEVLVFSNIAVSTLNLLIGLIPLGIITILFGNGISWTFPLAILVVILLGILIASLALFISIGFIRFRDFRSILPVVLMVLMYLTPVFYPKSILSGELLTVVEINPLVSFLDCLRWSFNGTAEATAFDWFYIFASTGLAFFGGIKFFQRSWPRTLAML